MPVSFKINPSFYEKLDEIRAKNALIRALKQTTLDLHQACMDECPKDTRTLMRSHSYEVRDDDRIIEGIIRNGTHYWSYVALGTSKRRADPYITRAIQKVQPGKKIAENFKQFHQTK